MLATSLKDLEFDVVIVGAGISGLAAAKTYLECSAHARLLLIDSSNTVGGVWAEENIYEGLNTNNLLSTFNWSDFPMGPGYGVKEGEHIPGAVLHKFLTDFAERYNILQLVKFRTTMTIAEKMDNGWRCTLETGDASATETSSLTCSKLMVATGLHSRAQPVHFSGEDNFKAPVLRFQDLARDGPHFLGDPKIETVTVFGGGKSAYDLVYYFASKGKKVEWIIRKSGHGPGWASTSHVALGWLEKLSTTRAMSWASPCIWGSADGYGWIRNVLHGTVVGRWLVDKFWAAVQSDIIKSNKYRNHPETEKLIPDASPFWYSTNTGILNYPTNIYDYVTSGQVRVYREDISFLSDHQVNFEDGKSIHVDCMAIAGGWEYALNIQFKPDGIEAKLGIPTQRYSESDKRFWEALDERADIEILRRYPRLLTAPLDKTKTMTVDPLAKDCPAITRYRLYRAIAPPGLTADGDRSLVFLKMLATFSATLVAEAQALWAYAYLNDELDIENSQVHWQAALLNRFGKLRYPYASGAARYPDFIFDSIPYVDMLLRDLGLKFHRHDSFFREAFHAYSVEDYQGLNQEWIKKKTKIIKAVVVTGQ